MITEIKKHVCSAIALYHNRHGIRPTDKELVQLLTVQAQKDRLQFKDDCIPYTVVNFLRYCTSNSVPIPTSLKAISLVYTAFRAR